MAVPPLMRQANGKGNDMHKDFSRTPAAKSRRISRRAARKMKIAAALVAIVLPGQPLEGC